MTGYFITGIGTGVGKTVVAAALAEGLEADYWKPVQCGSLGNTDSMKVAALVTNGTTRIFEERYRLARPISPHAAARAEGRRLRLKDFRLPASGSTLIMEGAGGLLVPLNDSDLVVDLIAHLGAQAILVSRHYLGSINHTLLTAEALRRRSVPVKGIVFNGPPAPETERIILKQTGLACLGRIPALRAVSRKAVQAAGRALARAFLAATLLLAAGSTAAQDEETYGLLDPGAEKAVRCGSLLTAMAELPIEEHYSVQVVDGQVTFFLSDEAWFGRLFPDDKSGIAVDIVTRDRFPCDGPPRLASSAVHRGRLMAPVYAAALRSKMQVGESGRVRITLGPLPDGMDEAEAELNLVLLRSAYACHYTLFYNLPLLQWKLLDMGLYRDTILPGAGATAAGDELLTLRREMRFVIPFAKDRYEYAPEHIRPLYDSLRLSDYVIRKIRIRAYSSVEGAEERNIMLQNRRAESIVTALQSFQKPAIAPEVSAAENWVEFLADIEGTSFAGLADRTKGEVKEKLKDEAFSAEMEPILSRHRKGVIVLDLEKKTRHTDADPALLRDSYRDAVRLGDLNTALAIQSALFAKITAGEVPKDFITPADVPMTAVHGALLRNDAAFRFGLHPDSLAPAIAAFSKLRELLPGDARVTYNLSVLQLRSWLQDPGSVDGKALLTQIRRLSAQGIDKTLVNRLLLNWHMTESGYLMMAKDYAAKDASVRYVWSSYHYLKLSDGDIFNLAKYFVHHARYDLAVKIMHDYVKRIDAEDEPLFYYLNLTVIHPERTRHRIYRSILLNAINADRKRFCLLFGANRSGGITFQLLGDDGLRKAWCESCKP